MSRKKKNRSAAGQATPKPAPAEDHFWRGISPRARHFLMAAVLGIVTLVPYLNSFSGGFPIDNDFLILQDPRLKQATVHNVSEIVSKPYWLPPPEYGLYRPFTKLTYLFNYAVLGDADKPADYHIFNFLLHFINVLLVYALALRLLRESSRPFWPAAFIAGLWAVHPVLTESVTNIVGRADLLAAFGVLSGFLMYLKSRESTGGRRISWLVGLMAATAVGVFSKESGVVIFPVVALYEICWWKDRKQLRGLLYGTVAIAVPLIAMLGQRALVLARSTAPEFPYVANPELGANFFVARLTAIKVLAHYLWLLAWPANLSWNYYYNQIPLARGSFGDFIAWIAIAASIAAAAIAFRRNRTAFFFASFAFVTLIPASNLIILIGSIMAERFLYLPAIGFAACLALAVFAICRHLGKAALAPIVLCLILAAYGVRTWRRNPDWQSNMSQMTAGVITSPDSSQSHFGLATELYRSDPTHANLNSAIEEAEKSLAILDPLPDSENVSVVYVNAGMYYEVKGDLLQIRGSDGYMRPSPASLTAYQRALEILLRGASIDDLYDETNREKEKARGKLDSEIPHTGHALVYQELALTYLRLGENQKAYEAVLHARLLDPGDTKTYILMAEILFALSRHDESAVALMEGNLISGDRVTTQQLSRLYKLGLDPKGCAFIPGPAGPTLNTACEVVHADICRALSELVPVFQQAHRVDDAAALKTRSANEFGCPAIAEK